MEKPFSVTLGLCDPVAAMETLIGEELSFEYKRVTDDLYDIRIFKSKHPEELKNRLIMKPYQYHEGDITFADCPACGVPEKLSSYHCNLYKVIIASSVTGRRMVFFAPTMLDSVFSKLERELGKTIPELVIEAQRNFTKAGLYSPNEINDVDKLRQQLALRGLGKLREFEMDGKGLRMRLDNAAAHLMIVGPVQDIYEMAFEAKSEVQWELSGEGDLRVEVKPRARAAFPPPVTRSCRVFHPGGPESRAARPPQSRPKTAQLFGDSADIIQLRTYQAREDRVDEGILFGA
ncbi:MAG: hypothetical protein SWK76_15865 [Actinomycetota bacterium]|nr:hypothetical protein [Actinomycetota bacterium]